MSVSTAAPGLNGKSNMSSKCHKCTQCSVSSFRVTSVHTGETSVSTLGCIGLTFFFLWSKAIILNVKRRLAILCGMLLLGVSDTPQQHSTSNSKTRCLSSVLRFCHVLRCSLTDYNLCFLSSTPPELCFKVTLSERNKKAAQFIDLSRFVQK